MIERGRRGGSLRKVSSIVARVARADIAVETGRFIGWGLVALVTDTRVVAKTLKICPPPTFSAASYLRSTVYEVS